MQQMSIQIEICIALHYDRWVNHMKLLRLPAAADSSCANAEHCTAGSAECAFCIMGCSVMSTLTYTLPLLCCGCRQVLRVHKSALYAQRSFWKVLLHSNVTFSNIVHAFRHIESCRSKADKTYKAVLERYPTNIKVSAYAAVCLHTALAAAVLKVVCGFTFLFLLSFSHSLSSLSSLSLSHLLSKGCKH